MGILRNVASQKWRVYAWDVTTGLAKTGDAANISAKIQIDDGAAASTNDVAPSEVHATDQKGYYEFDLTQAETNGAKLSLAPQSSTSNISVIACPPVAYTVPRYLSMLNVASDGDFAGNLDGTLATLTTYTGNTPQTGDAYAIVNSGEHGNAAIKGYVDDIGTAGAGLTAIPWNAAWDAEVQSEVDDALVAQKLDHLVAVADADDPVNNSIIAKLASKGATADWSSFVNTTDSLEALRDRGDAAWITATGFSTHSAADVWASGTRTLTAGTNIDGSTFTAIPWNASWDAEVQSEVTDALEATVADSVPADGTRPSVASACYMICQGLFEGTISGTTWTIKKVDGSTTLFTVTLNDGTTPTGKTRA